MSKKISAAFADSREGRNAAYSSVEWIALRNYYRALHPYCEDCEAIGYMCYGQEIHHIQSVEKHPELFLDIDNLRNLCRECHEKYTRKEKKAKELSKGIEKEKRIKIVNTRIKI